MAEFSNDLRRGQEKIVLREHFGIFLKVFIAGFLLAALVAVLIANWTLTARIQALKDQATLANDRRAKWEEEFKRQAQLTEQYRERYITVTRTNTSLASLTHEELQGYAESIVAALQAPIREHETTVEQLESVVWSRILSRTNAYEIRRILEQRATAEWQAGQKCMADYNIHFKDEVLTLRREILSRIPPGNDRDRNGLPTEYWYNSPWNFHGFKRIVADLERIANLLPVSKEHAQNRTN